MIYKAAAAVCIILSTVHQDTVTFYIGAFILALFDISDSIKNRYINF